MSLIDKIFGRDDKSNTKTTELEAKVSALEAQLTKSLNSSLAAIVGNQWIDITTKSYENAYETNYVINRGIQLLAQNIAGVPLDIYKGDNIMDDGFRFPNFDLQNPNKEMSLNEWMYQCCIYYFYRGEFMSYINLDGGSISLEPVNPKLMKIKTKDATGRVVSWEWNNKKIIPAEQLIYLRLINPDGERGLSPIDVVKSELINDDKAREYNTKYFENYGKVGGLLFDDKGMAQMDDMKRLVEQFNAAHQGSKNAHKILGLPAGIKYQELAQTMKEMEFAAGRADVRDRILGILGIHKAVFGISDNITYQTQKDAMRMLWQMTLQPSAVRIQEKLNQQLLNKYFPGYQCFFDFAAVPELQENDQDILNQAKGYRELGYTLNEINEYFDLGMDEVQNSIGDMRFIPSNLIPATDLENTNVPPQKSINSSEIDLKLDKIIDFMDKEEVIDKSINSYMLMYNRLQRSAQSKFRGKLGKHFAEQLGGVLNILYDNTKSINKDIVEATLLAEIRNFLEGEKVKIEVSLKPLYEETSKDASALALKVIKMDKPARVIDEVVDSMVNKIKAIENNMYKLIRSQIKEGLLVGEGVDKLSNRIRDVYKFSSSYSARRIALTESASIINRSTDFEYRQNGVTRKKWIDTKDGKTRETHVKNGDLGAVPYDFVYPNGQEFPGDGRGGAPENINCRCAFTAIIE